MKLYTLILSLTYLFCFQGLLGQKLLEDIETYQVLVFEHSVKGHTRFLRVGAPIKYRLYSNPKQTQKGVLDKVTDKSIFVGGQELALSDLSMVSGRVRSGKDLFGGVLLGIGIGTMPFGPAILSSGGFGGGIALLATAVSVLVVGAYISLKSNKFHMTRGWSVSGGFIQFNRSHN